MREQRLVVNCFLSLFECLFNRCLHPVSIVECGPHIRVFQLLLDVLPYLSILEVGVELHNLHSLLFVGCQIVQVEAHSVEGGENGQSQVVALRDFLHSLVQVGFS